MDKSVFALNDASTFEIWLFAGFVEVSGSFTKSEPKSFEAADDA